MALYNNIFTVPNGMIDPLSVDLDATFVGADNLSALNRSIAINNGITSGLGFLNGLNGVIAANQELRSINDTPEFDASLNDVRAAGSRNYDTHYQLANAMAQGVYMPRLNYNNVYGKNGWQEAAGVGSAGISGAAAGYSLGKNFGPIGGLVGAGVGLLGGIGSGINSMLKGRQSARIKTDFGNVQMGLAESGMNATNQAEGERLTNQDFREDLPHLVARGGKIERESESIQDFANRVLGRKDFIMPKRTYCKGGVRVKIKSR